ncbi:probable folate-biopterin transporter 7 [Phoenix dactylifera]|uniref:Probable folate-biopterin transporter 7 n=1 Tax=Phoenix dactylifera TaxID=42345 RepID=A0A8B7BHE3_PHODC|nr:probable folate-biopterin transporter 7 [Phoenix dactylifera]
MGEKGKARATTMDRVKWVVGLGFWVQGFRCFPWLGVNFYLKDGLGVPASSLQILQNSANLPMVAKPLYGLLSDAVAFRGQRRLPYVALGALLQAVSWLAIVRLPESISIASLTLFLLLGNLGASIAEVANDAIVAEAGKQLRSPSASGQLQSFALMSFASAGALGNLLAGIAINFLAPRTMFLLFALLLVLQFFTTVAVSESSLNLPKKPGNSSKSSSIRKQLSELMIALRKPEISRSIAWFSASYAMVPLLIGTMFFYQTQHLNLDSSVIGFSKVFGQAALMAWSVAYNKQFKKTPARKVLSALQVTIALLMVSDVLFVKGFYRDMGVPDSVYVVIFSGLLEALLQFKGLPFCVLMAQLCPPGCEGSVMAFLMSALALATIVSGYLGVALAAFMGITGTDFSGLPVGILIQAACALLPLCWSSWIPDSGQPEKKEE